MTDGYLSFAGKTAVVTAATGGIGHAIAQRLLAGDANVVAAGRNTARLKEMQTESGRALLGVTTDVNCESDIAKLMAAAVERFGAIDCVFNVTGSGRLSRLVDTSAADWDAVMQLNLRSAFLAIKHAGKHMIAGGRGGAFVNISSINAVVPFPGGASYAASKAGLDMLTRNAAIELSSHRIRVNGVLPGLTETASTEFMKHPEIGAAYLQRIPLRRSAQPDEIAAPAVFLASDHASYITGATLVVDGGWTQAGYPDLTGWLVAPSG